MSDLVLTVHRATEQIGGNCIELEFDGHRLILDAGTPLDAGPTNPVPLSLDTTRPVDGVVISHPHQDHYGLLDALPASWPVWTGGPSEALIRLTGRLTGKALSQPVHPFSSFEPFDVGSFTVTPLLTDHSAFDAHMLLIDAAGRRVLYSGDFRRTGRKAALVDRLLARSPAAVDVLLMEGTTLGRTESFPTEADLEERFVELFRDTPGRVFVSWSAQNIDRTVTLYRASKRSDRPLVLDVYSLDVLEQLSAFRDTLPRLGWPGVRGVITAGVARMYRDPKRMDQPELVDRLVRTGHCISASKLEDIPKGVVMLRPSLLRDYLAKGLRLTANDAWVFSQWSGYLNQGGYPGVRSAFSDVGARFDQIHTSGHASRADLLTLANSVDAKALVPIHSFDWDEHRHAFPRVSRLRDGEPYQVQ